MTEPEAIAGIKRAVKATASNDKQPREATVWIGYQDDGKWYPFGSELAASRWALKGSKPRVQELVLGKPPE